VLSFLFWFVFFLFLKTCQPVNLATFLLVKAKILAEKQKRKKKRKSLLP